MKYTYGSGDRPLAEYTIRKPIGHGGFGEVYYALSEGGKEVALKLVQRFLEVELRGVKQCLNLKHPNLLTIYDVVKSDEGEQWIVMEYVDGHDLAEALDAHPEGLPPAEALRWLEGICAAVDHLHQAGIVHRDLKPSNVFEDGGGVKVGDYGLSKFITASRRSGQTQSIGTVHYMAPEVGSGRYGREVDVYAIGVMTYEMLTGEVPFNGETPTEVLMKHLTSAPDLSKLPPAWRSVVGRMLAKRPEDRYGSPQAVVADLKARLTDAELAETSPQELSQPVAGELPGFGWPASALGVSAGPYPSQFKLPRKLKRLGESVREHPVLWSLCLLMTLGLFSFPLGVAVLASGGSGPDVPMAIFLWIVFSVFVSGVFCSWALLWRSHSAPSKRPSRGGGGDRKVADPVLESDDEIAPRRSGRLHSLGYFVLSLFCGVGAALLTAGFSLMLDPRAEEVAFTLAFGAGFFTAGVILARMMWLVQRGRWLRVFAALFLGAASGLLCGGFGLLISGDEVAVLMGVGFGFLTFGLVAYLLFFGPLARLTPARGLRR